MPRKESRILDQRLQFLSSYQKEEMSVADLCRAYGISHPTAYRWINRYNETGPEGLVDRSSRPHSCSHATLEPINNTILVLRASENSIPKSFASELREEWSKPVDERIGLFSPTETDFRFARNSEVIGPLSKNEMAICHSWMPQFSVTGYSARKASTGFTDAARRAGRKLATADARPSKTATPPKVIPSHACTPNSSLRINIDVPTEQTSPIANPATVSHPACRMMSR